MLAMHRSVFRPAAGIVALALLFLFLLFLAPLAPGLVAQTPEPLDGRDGRPLALERFRPVPMLNVPRHELTRAKIPVVDAHCHPRIRLTAGDGPLDDYVRAMDRSGIAVSVSLDGRLGEEFAEHAKFIWAKHRDRFVIFANIDWQGRGKADDPSSWDCHRPDFGHRMELALADAKRQGASGLKIFKQFGLEYRNPDGSLVRIDDERWDPIWRACGELGLPILIHTADPAAFFRPIDETNERWEELARHPEWSFADPPGEKKFPRREELLAALNRVVARHPKTIFIAAHVANNAEDLASVGQWLDAYPNLNVDIASRIGELGRQPYTARTFLIRYADRILFATDGPWPEARLGLYWRFLETEDEYFPYSEKPFPPQGFWNIYGVHLPDDVLRKIYRENAARLIPGVEERLEKYSAGPRKE